jgi:hypothetical protein
MSIDATITKRFVELEAQMNTLRSHVDDSGFRKYNIAEWQQWATSVKNIIRAAFGEDSPHYENFAAFYEKCKGWDDDVDALKGIFRGAKADYDGGYAFSVQATISGEIYGDFVALAKTSLAEGAKDVAAVLACAALEDALKRFALMNGLPVSDKGMQEVVNALKAKGLVGGAQKTLLDTMPKVRDYAMHANWDKITPQDVGSVIGFVEQFLLAKFS